MILRIALLSFTFGINLCGAYSQTVKLSRIERAAGADYTVVTNADGKQEYILVDSLGVVAGDDWGTQVVEIAFGLLGMGVAGDALEVDTSDIATVYALQDSAASIRADFPVNTDAQNLTIGGSGPAYTVDISGGSDVTIEAAGIAALSEPSANVLRITATEVDGSVTNEIQTVDTLVLTGTTLGVSLSQDGVPQKTVDLSALQDGTGTDDQKIDTFAIVSNTLRLSLESDAEPFKSVDLSPYLDNTDNQTLAILADDGPGGDSLNLSISGGNWVRFFFLNTGAFGIFADQDGDDVLISVTEGDADPTNELQNLTIGGSGPAYTVDISSGTDVTVEAAGIATLSEPSANVLRITATEVDGSVTNEIQAVDTFSLSGTTVSLSLSQDGVPAATLDLASLQDGTGTDDQTLSWSSPNLSIESGNSVDLSALLDNTDDQKIDTFAIVSNTLRLSIESDAEPFKSVDLSPYLDNTDNQVVSLDSAGNWYTLTLEDGGSVSFTKDTDTQLSEEQVEDYVGGMVTGNTETLITVTYQDADGTIDFEVEPNLSNYTNDAGFLTAEVDGSVTNELQDLTIGGSGPAYTIDLSDGDDVTISPGDYTTLSEPTANTLRVEAKQNDYAFIQLNGETQLLGTAETNIQWATADTLYYGLFVTRRDSSYIRAVFDGVVELQFGGILEADSIAYTGRIDFRLYVNSGYETTLAQEGNWSLNEHKTFHATYILPVSAHDKLRVTYDAETESGVELKFPRLFVRRLTYYY